MSASAKCCQATVTHFRNGATYLPSFALGEARRERLAVAGATTGFWRPNERVYTGELIGFTVDDGWAVRASSNGRIVAIQYDVDRDEVILEVERDIVGAGEPR